MFSIITAVIIVCSLSISLLLYYRFNATMTKENREFITYTSNQVKSEISDLMKKNELIAGNIYSNNSLELFLKEGYYQVIEYSLFEMFNVIKSLFQGIRENSPDISSVCIYKLDPKLITDGKNVRDVSEFKRQDLIQKAIEASGNYIWASYTGDNGSVSFCLLRYLNLYKPGGVLVIEIKEESFYNLYRDGVGKNNLFIIDKNNSIISSNNRDSLGKDLHEVLGGSLPDETSAYEVNLNSTRYFFSRIDINAVWSITTLYNSSDIDREKTNITYFVLVLAGVFIFIGLLFSLFLASGFASQVDRLLLKIKEIEKGNLKIKPDTKKIDEFYQLDKTLCAMAGSIDRLNSDIVRAVKQKEESEIKYLQMQMNPHFLYNLLSVIRWTAYQNRQEKIIGIVDNLISFYRIALSKGNEIIDFSSEISLVKSYVELQNMCSSNRINLEINMDEKLDEMKISKMTLQPFVENSVIHGMSGDRQLNIRIDIRQEETGEVVIRIEDDGIGISDEVVRYIENINDKSNMPEGKHFGIINTVTRLNLLYRNVKVRASGRNPGTVFELIIDVS